MSTRLCSRIAALLMATVLACSPAAALTYAERVHEQVLPNGLKILLLEDHKAPVAVYQIWYRVGSRNETVGHTGLSHLLEHLMFKGTEKVGPEEYSKIIQRNGGNTNAFTTQDYTTYFATMASDRIAVVNELEADRLAHLQFKEDLFKPEQRVVMEERRMRTTDNPVSALFELINATAYVAHPYQWPIIGWMDDIRQATSSDAERYFHTYYQPNNAVVIAVGDFDSAELAAEIAKQFGSIPSGDSPPPVRSIEPQQQGERSVVLRREAQLPFIGIAYHTPNLHSPDAAAIEMLAAVLSGGKSARLYEQLVYRRQIARDVGANSDYTSVDPGMFTVYAQPLPGKKVSEVRQALLAEIEKIREKAPSAREVEKARNGIEAGFVFAQDSLFYQGMLLGQYEMAGDWRLIDKYLPAIRAVTAEDIRRVAAVYLIADNRTMGVLEPLPSKAAQPAPAALPPHGMVR